MGHRLILAAGNIIRLLVRIVQSWARFVDGRKTSGGKIAAILGGLFVPVCMCGILAITIGGGNSTRRPVVAQPAPTASRPTAVERDEPTARPTERPPERPTDQPTATTKPTATPEPTTTPTAVPPTDTPLPTATLRPRPTAAPAPTEVPAPSNPLNTHGRNLYNCDDFATYRDAYAVYQANLPGDPNDLDRDNDGIPCESLPGAP